MGESSLPEPFLLEEEVPETLGHKWRVLHPFELPGVRFPTDTNPSNQRRLAENDALMELIQTTEYLEDIPMWDNGIIGFTLQGMVTLFIEEEEGAEVEEGEIGWVRDLLKDIQLEDLEEVPLKDLEGEMVQDSIPKAH